MNSVELKTQPFSEPKKIGLTEVPKMGMHIRNGRLALHPETLRELRYQRCLSQDEAAAECKRLNIQVSVATLKRAEAGQAVIFRTARELAKFYQVPVESLCG